MADSLGSYEFFVTYKFIVECRPGDLQDQIKSFAEDPDLVISNAHNVIIHVDGEKEYDSEEDDNG